MIAYAKRALRRSVRPALNALRLKWQPPRWLLEPQALSGRDVCLLVTFSADGTLAEHTLALGRAWHDQGFAVILVVATDARSKFRVESGWSAFLDGVLVRPNIGYDFGSWASALALRSDLRQARLLALANDSLYGPLAGFEHLLGRVRASTAAIVGLTDSIEICHHLQSYLVFYKRRAMQSDAFARFWKKVPLGGREDVILERELKFLATMQAAGIDVDVLFPADRTVATNPTLFGWRALIEKGFPFVKVQLLRENPKHADLEGWEGTLRRYAYDPCRVTQHLGDRYGSSAAARFASSSITPSPPHLP